MSRPTKRQRAADLVAMVEQGPPFEYTPTRAPFNAAMATKCYRLWFQSFVEDELRDVLRIKPDEPGATS